jgi:hypothetical protein
MGTVVKTLDDVLRQGEAGNVRLTRQKYVRDEDIDTTDMPELTDEQLARMKPARFSDRRERMYANS